MSHKIIVVNVCLNDSYTLAYLAVTREKAGRAMRFIFFARMYFAQDTCPAKKDAASIPYRNHEIQNFQNKQKLVSNLVLEIGSTRQILCIFCKKKPNILQFGFF